MSQFVFSQPQTVVKEILSFVKYTNNLVNSIHGVPVLKYFILVSIDIKFLPTKILNNKCITRIKKIYYGFKYIKLHTNLITKFPTLSVMGTICVPAYANILMAEF